jgi:hypothetical protein
MRSAAETAMWACGLIAMLVIDAILVVVFLAVWKAR